MIRLTSVYKEYPRSGTALRDVTLNVGKGELVFLTGHSGAGKSTVMRLLQMAELPSGGEVRVSGFSSKLIRRREIPQLRRKIGVVFQDFRLLRDRTAEENVAFALEVTGTKRPLIGPRVNKLLTQVGLAHKARAYPDELSGGERQRVAVARALANEPLVLLADEPTGNLDEWAAKGVFELFREINAMGMTILMATHDLDLVRAHPEYRVVELSQGSVVYDSAAAAVEAGSA
ncbi:cell division ATP-binding protein FtsE [Longimicrobium terrae]|uniref:Cell division ATP-binding protein FtsE n=1 Tax=Longimicrobium terrae TaxID=1639882 RepID=A0A841H306_9BACT|nr:cell division transport system ATP-binding protein [Longimicrobium terrae]MBB6072384.1 cell division transport system ATP-binding protein [Longimicrobium terrae]NNC31302.1 cell division ATP-binding protein FtsE [Longimicrobium terrae]